MIRGPTGPRISYAALHLSVLAGLVPATHAFFGAATNAAGMVPVVCIVGAQWHPKKQKCVGGRDKLGHEGGGGVGRGVDTAKDGGAANLGRSGSAASARDRGTP